MWLEIEYSPTSLFSLKSSSATSSAGKTLFSPSPYAAKMAMLNAVITYDSIETAKDNFDLIKGLDIQFRLPEQFIVNNCMIKISKHNRAGDENDPFMSTVAFREYIYFSGNIRIAINLSELAKEHIDFLKKWFMHINYFGKKGCFFQFIKFTEVTELNNEYSLILNDKFGNLAPGTIIEMDDFDEDSVFDNINAFSKAKGKRRSRFYILPILMEKASKDFTIFSKVTEE